MAIRKFKKSMKPIVWIITILFLGSMIAGYVMSVIEKKDDVQTAFKLNGEKISNISVQRTMAVLDNNYTRYLGTRIDPEMMNIVSFNEVINRNLLLETAKKLKIKVPNSEVEAQMNQIKSSFRSNEEFKQVILTQGYTRKSLENEIKENMVLQKSYEAIVNKSEVSQNDVENYYEEFKYTIFNGKPLDLVKNQIVQELKEQKNAETFAKYIANARENMVITDMNSYYENFMVKEEFTYDGVEVTNLTFAKRVLNALMMTKGDVIEAKEMAKKSIEAEIRLMKIIEEKGIEVDSELPLEMQTMIGIKELFSVLKSEVKYTDKDLLAFFEKNKERYNVIATVDADIAVLPITPRKSDIGEAKEKAESIFAMTTKENFAEMAKKYSVDSSAESGGYLGTFSKGDMVQPFEEAVFKSEIGEIYPEVVQTQFGFHIILVESRDDSKGTAMARHILIMPIPSERTIEIKTAEADEIVRDLNKGNISFVDLKNVKDIVFSEKIDGITEEGYIPGIGYNEKLTKVIFASKLDESNVLKENREFIIYRKDKQVLAKKAVFEDVKDRVINDYVDIKAQEEIRNIEEQIKD